MPNRRLVLFSLAVVAAAGCFALLYVQQMNQGLDGQHSRRAYEVATSRPTMPASEVEAVLDRSDEVRQTLADAGVTDVGQEVWARIQAVEITPAERLAFYAENRDTIFGGRSYEESATSVDRLVRIRKVRAALENQ